MSFWGHGNNLINENNFEALNNLLSQILCELSLTSHVGKHMVCYNNWYFQTFRCKFSEYSCPKLNFYDIKSKIFVIKFSFMPKIYIV